MGPKLCTIVVLLAIGLNTIKGDEHEEAEKRLKKLINNRIKATVEHMKDIETVQVCAYMREEREYNGTNLVIKDYDDINGVNDTEVINKMKTEGVWVAPMSGKYSVAYIEDIETATGTAESHCKVSLHRNY